MAAAEGAVMAAMAGILDSYLVDLLVAAPVVAHWATATTAGRAAREAAQAGWAGVMAVEAGGCSPTEVRRRRSPRSPPVLTGTCP